MIFFILQRSIVVKYTKLRLELPQLACLKYKGLVFTKLVDIHFLIGQPSKYLALLLYLLAFIYEVVQNGDSLRLGIYPSLY